MKNRCNVGDDWIPIYKQSNPWQKILPAFERLEALALVGPEGLEPPTPPTSYEVNLSECSNQLRPPIFLRYSIALR